MVLACVMLKALAPVAFITARLEVPGTVVLVSVIVPLLTREFVPAPKSLTATAQGAPFLQFSSVQSPPFVRVSLPPPKLTTPFILEPPFSVTVELPLPSFIATSELADTFAPLFKVMVGEAPAGVLVWMPLSVPPVTVPATVTLVALALAFIAKSPVVPPEIVPEF